MLHFVRSVIQARGEACGRVRARAYRRCSVMWSAYFDTNPARGVTTRALGVASRRAYYGPFAPLRVRQLGRVSLPEYRWVRVQNTVAGISDDDLHVVHLNSDPRVSPMAVPRSSRVFLGREV